MKLLMVLVFAALALTTSSGAWQPAQAATDANDKREAIAALLQEQIADLDAEAAIIEKRLSDPSVRGAERGRLTARLAVVRATRAALHFQIARLPTISQVALARLYARVVTSVSPS